MEFCLFDVQQGQCAALQLPNGRWCIFDAGRSRSFSPIEAIVGSNRQAAGDPFAALFGLPRPFTFLKATISHLHGDHLADYAALLSAGPEFLRVGSHDAEYVSDVRASSGTDMWPKIVDFRKRFDENFSTSANSPDYGVAKITERALSAEETRNLGGSANSKVNNASVVSRIDCYGNSILLCGDMEKEAWDYVLKGSLNSLFWRPLVSNVDVLVAPHHGHKSGFSQTLMDLANPSVVLVSVASYDPSVDSRYSLVPGIELSGTTYKCVTTRDWGHIHFSVSPPQTLFGKGQRTWHGVPRSSGTWAFS